MKGRIEKLAEIKKSKKVDIFLLTSPASLKWLAGYFYNFETGPSPFHLLPAALIVGDGSNLVIADNETHQLPATSASKTRPATLLVCQDTSPPDCYAH